MEAGKREGRTRIKALGEHADAHPIGKRRAARRRGALSLSLRDMSGRTGDCARVATVQDRKKQQRVHEPTPRHDEEGR